MAEEKVFLDENGMFVSISRAVLTGTTYSTANITSVSKRVQPANRGCAFGLIILGGVFALGSLLALSEEGSGGVLLFSIALLGGGVLWLKSLKPTYRVIFASASGESEALSSQDEELISRVVAAVNQAIVARG